MGAVAGPAAASAVRSALTTPPSYEDVCASLYYGYGYYPWWSFGYSSSSWWFGMSWGWSGYYPSSCWSPMWTCSWMPYYLYGYSYYYPQYCKPSYYYPLYYSTIVHHVYEEDQGDEDVSVVVYADDQDDVIVSNEPVGEAAAIGSPLRSSLEVAADRYLSLGDRAFREGRYTDAAQFYAKAVEYAPTQAVLHLVLADALFATGDYHYAAYSIRRGLELEPTLAQAVVDKHEFYTDPAEFDRHIARAELLLGENPEDADVRLVLAANYLFGNRSASAVDLLEKTPALSGSSDVAAKAILDSARLLQYAEPAD